MTPWEIASIPIWGLAATLIIGAPLCERGVDRLYAFIGGTFISIPVLIVGAWLCS
jgi:hypothetical protein